MGVEAVYLIWFDNRKQPSHAKIIEAVRAYQERYGILPAVVLVNALDLPLEAVPVTVRAAPFVQRHNYWVMLEQA